MIIAWSEVPVDERHLLFCCDLNLTPKGNRRAPRPPLERPVAISTDTEPPLSEAVVIPLAAGFDAAGALPDVPQCCEPRMNGESDGSERHNAVFTPVAM